jgi:hypothetical protein
VQIIPQEWQGLTLFISRIGRMRFCAAVFLASGIIRSFCKERSENELAEYGVKGCRHGDDKGLNWGFHFSVI